MKYSHLLLASLLAAASCAETTDTTPQSPSATADKFQAPAQAPKKAGTERRSTHTQTPMDAAVEPAALPEAVIMGQSADTPEAMAVQLEADMAVRPTEVSLDAPDTMFDSQASIPCRWTGRKKHKKFPLGVNICFDPVSRCRSTSPVR